MKKILLLLSLSNIVFTMNRRAGSYLVSLGLQNQVQLSRSNSANSTTSTENSTTSTYRMSMQSSVIFALPSNEILGQTPMISFVESRPQLQRMVVTRNSNRVLPVIDIEDNVVQLSRDNVSRNSDESTCCVITTCVLSPVITTLYCLTCCVCSDDDYARHYNHIDSCCDKC